MERFRTYEPDQQVFVNLDPAETFGTDSFETYLVDSINAIDLSGFWSASDRGGEAPYDPRAMLGLILYGICQGIYSSRKLEHACRHDLGFMYVSGHNCPDHAAICRFLARHPIQIKEAFRNVVYIAHAKGYIDYHTLAIDGTKIRANVSKSFTGTIKDFRKRVGAIDFFIEKALKRLSEASEGEKEGIARRIARAENDKDRITEFLTQAAEIYNIAGTEKKQNMTDPDSRNMVFSDGTIREAYNAQACVDDKGGLIVATECSQDENDKKLLNPMLDSVVRPEGMDHEPVTVLADAGYWDPKELSEAVANGNDVYVPSPEHPNPFFEPNKAAHQWIVEYEETGEGAFGKCPGGRVIKARETIRIYKNRDKGGPARVFYLMRSTECENCPFVAMCLPGNKKSRLVHISAVRIKYRSATRNIEARINSPEGKRIYSRRMPLIEKVFADIKAVKGFRRFMRRGVTAVTTEWTLVCMAFNMRRMFALHQG